MWTNIDRSSPVDSKHQSPSFLVNRFLKLKEQITSMFNRKPNSANIKLLPNIPHSRGLWRGSKPGTRGQIKQPTSDKTKQLSSISRRPNPRPAMVGHFRLVPLALGNGTEGAPFLGEAWAPFSRKPPVAETLREASQLASRNRRSVSRLRVRRPRGRSWPKALPPSTRSPRGVFFPRRLFPWRLLLTL